MQIDNLPRLSDDERDAADSPCVAMEGVPAIEQPALYTHGLTPMELLGHLTNALTEARIDLNRTGSLIHVATLALRQQDCDGDVADVLQNHAWPSLDTVRGALETAQQFIDRLEQLQEVSHG